MMKIQTNNAVNNVFMSKCANPITTEYCEQVVSLIKVHLCNKSAVPRCNCGVLTEKVSRAFTELWASQVLALQFCSRTEIGPYALYPEQGSYVLEEVVRYLKCAFISVIHSIQCPSCFLITNRTAFILFYVHDN